MVEDDPSTRKALQAILGRQGWNVTSASSLAEARPQLETQPDVLLLDLMLPDGDGIVLLSRIRQENWPIKVIVTTGSSDSVKLEAVRLLQPDFLLFKPVDLEQLLKAVNSRK